MNENIQETMKLPGESQKPNVEMLKKTWKEAVLKFSGDVSSVFYNISEQAALLDDDERDELGFSMTNIFKKYFRPFEDIEEKKEEETHG